MKLLRTVLFTPGNNKRMIEKVASLGADAVILDLEDAVPITDKEKARSLVRDSLRAISSRGLVVFARVNALATGLAEEDLDWVVQEGLVGVVLPKVESGDDVLAIERLVEHQEETKGLEPGSRKLIPMVETARGVLNGYAIAAATQRVIAICFGAIDFARDMGITPSRDGTELLYARSRVAVAARAARVQAIDSPWIDVADEDGLIRDARMARQLGFRGKLLIHPGQIEPVNGAFSPSESEVKYAEKVVEAYRKAEARGLGATSLEGRMIDVANFRQAEELLSLVEAISVRQERDNGR